MGTCFSKTPTKAQKLSESSPAQIQLGPSNSSLNAGRAPNKEERVTNQDTVSALHKEETECPSTISSEEVAHSNEASPLHCGELQAVGPALTSFTLDDSTNNLRFSAVVSIISSSSSEKDQNESVHSENDEDDTFDSDDDVSLAKPEGRKVSFSGRSVASRSSAATSQSVLALRISSNYYAAGGIVGGVVVGEGEEDSDDEMDPEPESTTIAPNAVATGNKVDNICTTKEEFQHFDRDEKNENVIENCQTEILPSVHTIDNKRENDLNSFNRISDCEQKNINIAEAMSTSSTAELHQLSDNDVINENSTIECIEPVIVAGDQSHVPDNSSKQDEIVAVAPTLSINDQTNDCTSSNNSGDIGDNVNSNNQEEVSIFNVNESSINNDNSTEANSDCGAENGPKIETVRYMSATQVLQQQQRERQLSRSVSRDSQEHEDAKRRHFLQLGRATLVTQHSHSLDNLTSKSDNNPLNAERLSNSDRGKNSGIKNKPNQKQTKISLHQKSVHARQQLGGNSHPHSNTNARSGDDKLVINDNEDKC